MIRKIMLGAAGVATLATTLGVVLVAVFFALYSLARPQLGGAGASAVVVAAIAVLIMIAALVLGRAKGGRKPHHEPTPGERLGEMMREHPVLAGAGALAAGLIALKNPRLAATLASLFAARATADDGGRRRR